jgi:hypothetical protein
VKDVLDARGKYLASAATAFCAIDQFKNSLKNVFLSFTCCCKLHNVVE